MSRPANGLGRAKAAFSRGAFLGIALVLLSTFPALAATTVLVPAGSTWRYLDNGSDQGTAWIPLAFDDSSWAEGPAELGYGDGGEATVLSFGGNANDKHITSYFRRRFAVNNAASFNNLLLNLRRDDGAVVHLNGSEVARHNMPAGLINSETPATAAVGNADEVAFFQTALNSVTLLEGENILAVEIHQANPTSSDISFDLSLVNEVADTPPTINITSPMDAAEFPSAPSSLPLTADASDPDGTVTAVDFHANQTLLGSDSAAPYEFTWNNPPIGFHTLTAVATDNAGNSTTSAPVQITIGNPGFALQFDGANDYVTFGPAPGLGASALTIEAWVRRTGTGATANSGSGGVTAVPLVTKGRGEADNNNRDLNYFFGIRSPDNVLAADFEEGAGGSSPGLNHPVAGITPLSLGVWYHAAVTYDGATWRLYLDGTLERELPIGQPLRFDSIQHAALGTTLDSAGTPGGYFAGLLDEVRIWDHARSGAEIADDMDREITAAPGLLGRWGLNEGFGPSAGDTSGNSINGTLVNGPVWVPGLTFLSPPAISISTPANNSAFLAPATIGLEVLVNDPSGSITGVSYFEETQLLATVNTDPFSATWANVPQGHYSLTAVAQSDSGLSSTSAPVVLRVDNPVVQITSPAHNTRLITPVDAVIEANATPTSGTITLVEFFQDETRLGEDDTAPYTVNWTGPPIGDYLLTAVATDSGGILHTSLPISVVVATNNPPSVAINTPTNGAAFTGAPRNIPVGATATDTDGAVVQVEFFEGTVSLGTDSTPPYGITWNNVPVGNYSLTAVATDDLGATRASLPVNIVVAEASLTRGPYLQIGTPNSATIRWRTGVPTPSRVRFGPAPDDLPNIVDDPAPTTEHSITLTGLEAETRYYYSIGTPNGSIVIDADLFLVTSPVAGTPKPARIWVLGDSGTADANARNVRDGYLDYAAATGRSDLVLMLGDNAYNTGTDAEHQAAVFDTYPTVLKNTFLYPTIGNHDAAAAGFPYLDIFDLPVNAEGGGLASGTERYYSFDYANIHFICLDSQTSSRSTNSPMVTWLIDDLAATSQEWIIAFWHHPPYSRGSHNSDTEAQLIDMRSNILPFLEAGGVDLVLAGHSHSYERSYFLNGHYNHSSTFNSTFMEDGGSGREDDTGAYLKPALDGAVYVTAGSSGKTSGGPLNHPAHYLSINVLGSMVIDVASNRLDAVFLDINGAAADYFTLLKGDSQPEPPAPPANLISSLPTSSQIKLVWSNNATNEAGYRIERSSDSVHFTEIAQIGANLLSYLDSGLTPGTTWFYRLRSFNNAGNSDPSQVTSQTTPGSPITITLNSPGPDSSGIGNTITLDATPADPQGDPLTVTFYGREIPPQGPDFTIAVLPDTQYYHGQPGKGVPETFYAQTGWIVANRQALNIAYTTHLGDCVDQGDNGGNNSEWLNVTNALYRLEDPTTTFLAEGIPYGVSIGNHDSSPFDDPNGTTLFYNQFFGAAHFAGRSYYGGHYGTNNDNHFDLFEASGLRFIVVYMEYDTSPDAPVLAWANQLLLTHSDRRAIIVTHHLIGAGNPAAFSPQGQAVYNALKGNLNLSLMLGGHASSEGRREDLLFGNTVHSVLSDYQSRANGGDGWMRTMEFSPSNNVIRVKTYSPTRDEFENDDSSRFDLPSNLQLPGPGFTPLGTNTLVSSGSNTSLTWTNLDSRTTYEWFAAVTDGTQHAVSATRQFTTSTNFPPTITLTQPAEGDGFTEGTTITLEAAAFDPDGTVDKVEFFEGTTPLGEATAEPFSFSWISPPLGPYSISAVATDNLGTTTTSLTVNILITNATFLPAEITTHPQAQLAQQGGNVTFTVAATGTAPLTYQWKRNGIDLPGATNSSLNIPSAQPSDAGTYSVVVDNTFSVTSLPALLQVNQPPVPGTHLFARHPGSPLKIPLATLAGTDPDLDPLSFTALGPLTDQGGTLSTNGAWLFYLPPPGFTNADSFSYTVSDSRGGSTDSTALIQIASGTGASRNQTIHDLGGGSFDIVFAGVPARTYIIQYTDDLQTPDWQDLTTEIADASGAFHFIETPPGGTITRFYRSIEP